MKRDTRMQRKVLKGTRPKSLQGGFSTVGRKNIKLQKDIFRRRSLPHIEQNLLLLLAGYFFGNLYFLSASVDIKHT